MLLEIFHLETVSADYDLPHEKILTKNFVKKMLKEIIGIDAGQVIIFALFYLIRNSSSSLLDFYFCV